MSYNKSSTAHKAFLTHLNTMSITKSLSKALGHEKWREAMRVDMDALEKNATWDMVELPRGKTPVGCRWVYTVKYKEDESLERYKARLVAKVCT